MVRITTSCAVAIHDEPPGERGLPHIRSTGDRAQADVGRSPTTSADRRSYALLVGRRSAPGLVRRALEPNSVTVGVVDFAVSVAPERVHGCEMPVVSGTGQCCVHLIDRV